MTNINTLPDSFHDFTARAYFIHERSAIASH